jgi:hypothetical protein
MGLGNLGDMISISGDYYFQFSFGINDSTGSNKFFCYAYDHASGIAFGGCGGFVASSAAHYTTFSSSGLIQLGGRSAANISFKVINVNQSQPFNASWNKLTVNLVAF